MIDNLSFQIRYLGQKTNTQFIFIAPSYSQRGGLGKWYRHLSKFVQETDNYVRLTSSKRFADEISHEYRKLKSTVRVTHSTSENVEVKLESDCNDKTEKDNFHICKYVEEAKTLKFKATINVDKNFCKEDLNTTVEIKLEGTQDKMILNIECEKCHCGETEMNSEKCKGQGDLICGGCQCQ